MYGSIYGGPWGDTPNHPSHERREDAVPVEQFPKSPQILPMATAHSDVSKNVFSIHWIGFKGKSTGNHGFYMFLPLNMGVFL